MKLGKIFICINILVLSLLMLEKWPRIIYQNTSYRFDEYNRTIVLDDDSSFCGGTAMKRIVPYLNFRYIGMERFISNDRLEGTYPYHIRES